MMGKKTITELQMYSMTLLGSEIEVNPFPDTDTIWPLFEPDVALMAPIDKVVVVNS